MGRSIERPFILTFMDDQITSRVNQYLGVNAHFHSLLQTREGIGRHLATRFAHTHLYHICEFLNSVLPSQYVAQFGKPYYRICIRDILDNPSLTYVSGPDIAIYRQSSETGGSSVMGQADEAAVTTLEQTLNLSEDFMPLVRFPDMSTHEDLEPPVARIRLLSPVHKVLRKGYEGYRRDRNAMLYSGISLIELDYLHELPSHIMHYPAYPKDVDSHPYNIFVSDPRPSIQEGYFYAYGFDVDKPIPVVNIPLSGDETISFDFGAVYRHTFENGGLDQLGQCGNWAKYNQLPLRLNTYSPSDQEAIKRRMAAIADARARGLDLEQGPLSL